MKHKEIPKMNREKFDTLKGLLSEIEVAITSINQTFDDVEFTPSEKTDQEIAYDFDVEDIIPDLDTVKDLINNFSIEIEDLR